MSEVGIFPVLKSFSPFLCFSELGALTPRLLQLFMLLFRSGKVSPDSSPSKRVTQNNDMQSGADGWVETRTMCALTLDPLLLVKQPQRPFQQLSQLLTGIV